MAVFPVIPDPNQVLLIDTSKWQNDPDTPKNVDYALMKSRGCAGVIMKVGQGTFLDRDWEVNSKNAKEANLPLGGYWYYDNRIEPKKQASLFAEATGDGVTLGLWLDLEDKQLGKYQGWKNWYTFLEKIKELQPKVKLGIYTGYYYWMERTVMSQIPPTSLNYFKQFPLWIASYNASPRIPEPWKTEYLIWQFTDLLDGKYYGAESIELDGNYFNGTLQEYEEFFGIDPSTRPDEFSEPSKKFIVGLQEYALVLGGDLESIKIIEVTSKTNREESLRLMNYILDLDRKSQGA